MCLIISRPLGGEIDWLAAERAARYNRDGYGIACYDGNKAPTIFKSMRWEEVRNLGMNLERRDVAFILHMRYATHGAVKKLNCHPFRLAKHGMVMMHNGIIDTIETPAGQCDSRVLAKLLNDSMPQDFLTDSGFYADVEELAGSSRLAFMTADGEILYVNEDLGAWSNGCWYSVPSACAAPRRSSSKKSKRKTGSDFNPTLWDDRKKPAGKSGSLFLYSGLGANGKPNR